MVIYTGRVELIVEDFDEAQAKLAGVIEAHKAYVAHSETTGEPHTPRSGKWTLRVPVAGFDALMDAVAGLGEARKKTKDSDDVTDRYFDTRAEVDQPRGRARRGCGQLYEKKIAGTNMDELLKVNQELTRVRGVDQRQARPDEALGEPDRLLDARGVDARPQGLRPAGVARVRHADRPGLGQLPRRPRRHRQVDSSSRPSS